MLLILIGKSGSGKDAVMRELTANHDFERIVSTTTRPMRVGEQEGREYHYISKEQFLEGIEHGDFLEYRSYNTIFNGESDTWYYGSPKKKLEEGKNSIAILDVQGAQDYISYYGKEQCRVAEIIVPNTLREQRARERGSFSESEWKRRAADDEIKFAPEKTDSLVDYRIKNTGTLEAAVDNLLHSLADEQLITLRQSEQRQEQKQRIFVDMDGTLARFHDEDRYLERMWEQGFFEQLKPFENAVDTVKLLAKDPNVEVYILSAAIEGEPPYCVAQKHAWLDRYLPEVDKQHRIFTAVGENKAELIPQGIRKTDVLIDDYNKNLDEWQQYGGHSVKFVNNINHRGLHGELWQGDIIYHDKPAAATVQDLKEQGVGKRCQSPTKRKIITEQQLKL